MSEAGSPCVVCNKPIESHNDYGPLCREHWTNNVDELIALGLEDEKCWKVNH